MDLRQLTAAGCVYETNLSTAHYTVNTGNSEFLEKEERITGNQESVPKRRKGRELEAKGRGCEPARRYFEQIAC